MNISELKPRIYGYLGFKGAVASPQTDALIAECLTELDEQNEFRVTYKIFTERPAFLNKPPYESFLKGANAVVIEVASLGATADARIKYLSVANAAKAVVFDACASAFLEACADEWETRFGETRTYRFCPGYGGSEVYDLKYVFELLQPEKVGVTLSESYYMLPSKTVAGIIGIGISARKSCENCFMLPHCEYRKEGARCYDSEKN